MRLVLVVSKARLKKLKEEFSEGFSEKPGQAHVAWHKFYTGNAVSIATKPNRYMIG